MARILHLEAGPPACSIAISKDGILLGERIIPNREAVADLMVLCRELLESLHINIKDIDAVSVPAGPGSYTSLRTGYAMAKGLCASLQIPLICLPSLEILLHAGISALPQTQNREARSEVLCLMHARKNQFLGQIYDVVHKKPVSDLMELGPSVPPECQDILPVILDSDPGMALPVDLKGPVRHAQKNAPDQLEPAWKRFRDSDFDDLIHASPLYVYDPHITKPKPKFYN